MIAIDVDSIDGASKEGKAVPGAVYSWAFDDKIVKPFIPEQGFHCTGKAYAGKAKKKPKKPQLKSRG